MMICLNDNKHIKQLVMNENARPHIFKFPDGDGGYIYSYQDPDTFEWVNCDKDGTPLKKEVKEAPASPPVEEMPHASPKEKRTRHSQKQHFGTKTSLYLDEDLFIRAKHYCADYRITLTELINRCLLLFLKKAKKKAAKEERQNDAEAE